MTLSLSGNPVPDRWRHLFAPGSLLGVALILCWVGLWLVYLGELVGVGLALIASILVMFALRRLQVASTEHAETLRNALMGTAARNRELDGLQKVAATLLSSQPVEAVFHEVALAAADLLEAEAGAVTLVVEEGRFVRVVAGAGEFERIVGQLIPVDGSLLGWVVSHEEPLTSSDMDGDPRSFPLEGMHLNTAAIIPLRSAGLVIGTLSVCNRRDTKAFGPYDLQLLQTLGDQVVVGLDRAHVLDESRRNERALAAKNRELQRATELKSQFLANMSHELRTPLNAINGFSDLILTEELGPVNETQREFLESILRNGRHLLGLINSILDLAKIEAGRMTLSLATTDLCEAITGAVNDTSPLRSAKRQEVQIVMDATLLAVLADGTRVRQVLFNLLSNASKFTPERGQITLSAVATRAPLPIPSERAGEMSRLVARDAVWVSVSDTGIGIKPEDMPKLFNEFSQVDSSASRQAQGTGLGLALSKKFVEMHGGTIGAESIYGKGASFWFILPVEGPLRRPSTTG
jgi:signal transduction histidine kinase